MWEVDHVWTAPSKNYDHSINHSTILGVFLLLLLFWPHCVACGILVPWPGIEPVPPALEAWSPSHWTAREFPTIFVMQDFPGCPVVRTPRFHCWGPGFDPWQGTKILSTPQTTKKKYIYIYICICDAITLWSDLRAGRWGMKYMLHRKMST